MKRFAGFAAFLLVCVVSSAAVHAAEKSDAAPAVHPKAVVELFTSQGCSSCVAADAYFADLAERKDVVALSLHVDYWDYLGWQDTLADPAHTERQRAYSAVHGTSRVFTPQIVVNGGEGFVGSDRSKIEAAIAGATLSVPVVMRRGDGTVEIEVAGLPNSHIGGATIRLVLLTAESEIAIGRGENAGSTIDYYNIVRAMRPVGMWHGDPVKISLPQHEIMHDGVNACAIIVQEDRPDGPGQIIGAALLSDW